MELEVDTKETKKNEVETEIMINKKKKKVDTFQRKINFLEVLRNADGNVKLACRKINISRSAYYKWLKKDKKFKKLVDEVREEIIDDVEASLIERIHNSKNGGVLAIQWLKSKAKHRGWGESNEDDKKNIKVKIEFV